MCQFAKLVSWKYYLRDASRITRERSQRVRSVFPRLPVVRLYAKPRGVVAFVVQTFLEPVIQELFSSHHAHHAVAIVNHHEVPQPERPEHVVHARDGVLIVKKKSVSPVRANSVLTDLGKGIRTVSGTRAALRFMYGRKSTRPRAASCSCSGPPPPPIRVRSF